MNKGWIQNMTGNYSIRDQRTKERSRTKTWNQNQNLEPEPKPGTEPENFENLGQ